MSTATLDQRPKTSPSGDERMVERDRVQEYAEGLRAGEQFLCKVSVDIVIEVAHEHSNRLASSLQERGYTALEQPSFQAVDTVGDSVKVSFPIKIWEVGSNIEKFLKNPFQEQDLWEQKAAWILGKLDAWNAGQPPEAIPSVLSRTPGAETGRVSKESYLIQLCAFYTATEFLTQLDLPNFSLTELEIVLELRPGMNETTQKLSQLQKKILVKLLEKTGAASESTSEDLGFEWKPWEWFEGSEWFDKTKSSRRINLSRSLKNLEDRGLIIRQSIQDGYKSEPLRRTTHVKLTGLGRLTTKMLTNKSQLA